MNKLRRLIALAASMAAVCGVATFVATPAHGQAGPTGTATITLAGQDSWAPTGAPFTLRLVGNNVPPGSSIAVTVQDSVDTRTAFDESLNGSALPAT